MFRTLWPVLLIVASLTLSPAMSQQVHENARYCRLIVLEKLVGSGGKNDAKRPEFTPAAITSREGILAWSMQTSDDGHYALVHLVAVNRKAFDAFLNDKRSDVRIFEIGKDKKEDIEKELKKFKKDFDLESFQVVAR